MISGMTSLQERGGLEAEARISMNVHLFAGIIDIRAQIAGGRLRTIPQGDEVFPNASNGEDVAAQWPERPYKAAQDKAQHSSEPEAPSTPIKGESLPNSNITHSQHRSRESCHGRSKDSDRAGQRYFRKARLCDLSGSWLPVLTATAIVMVITAASLYSASACLPHIAPSIKLPVMKEHATCSLQCHPERHPLLRPDYSLRTSSRLAPLEAYANDDLQ